LPGLIIQARPGRYPAIFECLVNKVVTLSHFWQVHYGKDVGNSHTKTVVPVDVVGVVPVTVGTTSIPAIIVERTTAQHAFLMDRPSTTSLMARK